MVYTLQDFASAGANMYTFHLEAVVPDASAAKHPVDKMEQVLKEVKDAGEAHPAQGHSRSWSHVSSRAATQVLLDML